MENWEHSAKYKYKLILAYDGTNYNGWQIQPNGRAIQEVLEEKLKILLRRSTPVIGAGRTDAGVHALGQVAHFKHHEPLNTFKMLASLNGLLPKDIRVSYVEEVPIAFHARYSVINKVYYYHLNLGFVQDPFKRLYSWHVSDKLDLSLLHDCAQLFVGTHDFTSFANESHSGAAAKNPVRTVKRIAIIEERAGVRLEFEGSGFLYKMIRNLTGIMVEVAKGKRSLEQVSDVLLAKDRRRSAGAAPPQGLFLVRVDYPNEFSGSSSRDEK